MGSTTQTIVSSLSHISADWLIIAILVIVFTVDALRSGSGRAAALALSLPIASVFFSGLSKTALVAPLFAATQSPLSQAIIFVLLSVGLYLILNRIMPRYDDISSWSPLLGVLAGVAAAIAILVTWVHLPFLAAIWQFHAPIPFLFDDPFRLWWLLASFLALAFVRG